MVTPQAIEASDGDRISPIRTVGCIFLGALSASGEGVDNVWVKERIHLGIETPDGVQVDETLWDPLSPSENFLWERTRAVQGVQNNANNEPNIVNFSDDTMSLFNIDLKVSRRIEPPFVLLYTVSIDPTDTRVGRVRAWGWLRMLLSR